LLDKIQVNKGWFLYGKWKLWKNDNEI
jgi:hypothetical protein